MSRDLIRMMHALFLPAADAVDGPAPWRPNADVYRTATGWLVKFEVAGVRADDIELHALGPTLTLYGVRRDPVLEASGVVHHVLEISYSAFERTLRLPCDVKAADVSTELRDGLLLVHITPKPEARS